MKWKGAELIDDTIRSFVYIINFENGKRYIGYKSTDRGLPWEDYNSSSNKVHELLNTGVSADFVILKAFKTYDEGLEYEGKLLTENNVLYNDDYLNMCILGREFSTIGRVITKETRKKISKNHKGKVTPPDVRLKISQTKTGSTHNASTRAKMREQRSGQKNSNWSGWLYTPYGVYETTKQCSLDTKIPVSTIRKRVRSKNFPEWYNKK